MAEGADGAGPEAAGLLPELLRQSGHTLPDLWGRRRPPRLEVRDELFGRPVTLRANDERLGAAFAECRRRYSRAPAGGAPLEVVALVGDADPDPGPVPHVVERSWSGADRWVSVQAGAWGRMHVELDRGAARIVVHPRLAERADLLAGLLDTTLLNLLIGAGFGMLHASCLIRGGTAVLVLGDHGAGKSTTSLRLLRAGGFALLTDSMVFVDADPAGQPRLHGFPVGRIKLRADVAAALCAEDPTAAGCLAPERVRDETKHVLDLGRFAPAGVRRDAAVPEAVHLCLLRRAAGLATSLHPAGGPEVAEAVLANSLFYDRPEAWEVNAARLGALLARCACHHLEAGTDGDALAAALAASADAG